MDLVSGLPSGSLGTTGMGLDLVSQKVYGTEDAQTDSIGRANLDGIGKEIFLTLPSHQPVSVAVEPSGQFVYLTDFTPNEGHRVNIDGTGDEVDGQGSHGLGAIRLDAVRVVREAESATH